MEKTTRLPDSNVPLIAENETGKNYVRPTINLIKVKIQVEGLHQWKDCPIVDVSFLKCLHRHLFFITCKKEVTHKDRDIEIIMFKRQIEQYLKDKYGNPCNFGQQSCEMIAQDLFDTFKLYECEVLEDNENGGIVKYVL